MNRGIFISIIGVFAVFCACSDRVLENDLALDSTFPSVEVFEPIRGTVFSGQTIWVRGQVRDNDNVRSFTVGDQSIEFDTEGYFETPVTFSKNGLHIIETSVIDGAGNESKDVRSVMSMSENSSTDVIKDAVSLFLGPGAFDRIAQLIEGVLDSDSLPEAVVAAEPFDIGGSCLGATLDIESFVYEDTDMSMVPESGVIRFASTIRQLRTDVDTRFKVSCIPGRADVVATVDEVNIRGAIAIEVADGKVVAQTDETLVTELIGFDLDIDNVPGVLESLLRNSVRTRIEESVEELLAETIPEMVTDVFEGFSGGQAVSVIEKEIFVQIVPTAIELETRGMDLVADASTFIDAYTAPHNNLEVDLPATGQSGEEFEMFLSSEFVNQFSATLWSSGVLDTGVPIEGVGRLAATVSKVNLGWLLPPFVDKSQDLEHFELKIGDAFTVASQDGNVVTQIAISSLVEIDIGITDGLLALEGQAKEIWLDFLEENVVGPNVFANSETEALASHSVRHGLGVLLDLSLIHI